MPLRFARRALASFSSLLTLAACSGSSGPTTQERATGQSEFESVTPSANGSRGPGIGGPTLNDGAEGPSAGAGASGASAAPRQVEETDLYRLDGDRLFYLNAYRGLMVFDVSNVDAPKLLGRSLIPIGRWTLAMARR